MVISRKLNILVSAPLDFLPELHTQINREANMTYAYKMKKKHIKILLSENAFEAWMVSPCPEYIISGKLMDLCPSLKIITTPSTGSNHIDIEEAQRRKIKVFSLKGSKIIKRIYASSEFLLVSVVRKTPYAFQAVLDGKWREVEHLFRGRELEGLRLGIIGYGRIGSNLNRYAQAFRMKVSAYDPYVSIDDDKVDQFQSLPEMLSTADIVATCVHLNNKTFKLINDDIFDAMKEGVYFINTSRGDVVDEIALIKNLKNGKILAAGVDVISNEFTGERDNHLLIQHARNHDNLIITPHIAGLTRDSEHKAQAAAYEALKEYLEEGI